MVIKHTVYKITNALLNIPEKWMSLTLLKSSYNTYFLYIVIIRYYISISLNGNII